MITVSAKALWWREPEVCDCAAPDEEFPCPHDTTGGWPFEMFFTEFDGWQYLTDRYVMLPVARLSELPIGYDQVLKLKPLSGQATDGLAEWMTAEVLLYPSDRLFGEQLIDPLEKAGFLIRALAGVKDVHGICDPDLTIVGLISAVSRKYESEPSDWVRRAAR